MARNLQVTLIKTLKGWWVINNESWLLSYEYSLNWIIKLAFTSFTDLAKNISEWSFELKLVLKPVQLTTGALVWTCFNQFGPVILKIF